MMIEYLICYSGAFALGFCAGGFTIVVLDWMMESNNASPH